MNVNTTDRCDGTVTARSCVNVNTTDATTGATALLLPAQNTHTLHDPMRPYETRRCVRGKAGDRHANTPRRDLSKTSAPCYRYCTVLGTDVRFKLSFR